MTVLECVRTTKDSMDFRVLSPEEADFHRWLNARISLLEFGRGRKSVVLAAAVRRVLWAHRPRIYAV